MARYIPGQNQEETYFQTIKKRRPLKRSLPHRSKSQPMEGSPCGHAVGLTRH